MYLFLNISCTSFSMRCSSIFRTSISKPLHLSGKISKNPSDSTLFFQLVVAAEGGVFFYVSSSYFSSFSQKCRRQKGFQDNFCSHGSSTCRASRIFLLLQILMSGLFFYGFLEMGFHKFSGFSGGVWDDDREVPGEGFGAVEVRAGWERMGERGCVDDARCFEEDFGEIARIKTCNSLSVDGDGIFIFLKN